METDFEHALSGVHGERAKEVAERAVSDAVANIGQMLAAAKPFGGVMPNFASGGTFTALSAPIRKLDGECVVPLDSPLLEVRRRAIAEGYTELRFNPETMGWAYHKPDQALGEDGHTYVSVRPI